MTGDPMATPRRDLDVAEEHEGLRLDAFLTSLLPDRSRSQVQRLIKEGCGALHCHTQTGEGTTFTIYLPAAELQK